MDEWIFFLKGNVSWAGLPTYVIFYTERIQTIIIINYLNRFLTKPSKPKNQQHGLPLINNMILRIIDMVTKMYNVAP